VANVSAIKDKITGMMPRFESVYGSAFRDGLIGGGVLFLLIFGWMVIRSGDTAWKMQAFLPYKTAAIEEPAREPVVKHEAQPGLENVKNVNALPVAPMAGLVENFEGRQLPIVRMEDEMTAFQAYKKPFQPVAGRPMVSIVVVDFGLSELLSKSILDNTPPEMSLALSPYSDEPSKWAAAARAYGHEFWVMLPMQTKEYGVDDSGPSTILLNAQEKENQARLFDILGDTVGYAGLISQKGHQFLTDTPVSAPVLKQIFGRGLAFAESNPETAAWGLPMAMQDGYPYVQNNFWLDENLRTQAVQQKLNELELQATRKGKAVAFLHPYPAVMKQVQDWMKDAESKGIQIAPLSAMVQ
jgi:polysaccharide deacetylase 2 family uncharacterized protein YibQ